jgi:hypothetical protein
LPPGREKARDEAAADRTGNKHKNDGDGAHVLQERGRGECGTGNEWVAALTADVSKSLDCLTDLKMADSAIDQEQDSQTLRNAK